jgi:hypothetical protein
MAGWALAADVRRNMCRERRKLPLRTTLDRVWTKARAEYLCLSEASAACDCEESQSRFCSNVSEMGYRKHRSVLLVGFDPGGAVGDDAPKRLTTRARYGTLCRCRPPAAVCR